MAQVEGLGGVFFKADDPESLYAWYEKHLGLARGSSGTPMFHWREDAEPDRRAETVWALFPAGTKYFAPSTKPFMLNYRVKNLDAVLASLRAGGVQVDDRVEDYPYGRFGWLTDPEGNRIELWEPRDDPAPESA
jgi:predicted enzyme related to lactoylglutathione lyase